MMTKTQILNAWDDAMRSGRVRYPTPNHRHDGKGGFCALGVLDLNMQSGELGRLPSYLPSYINEQLEGARILASGWQATVDGAHVYTDPNLACTLASVFNVTVSFDEARAWLDKELTRLVDEGQVQP